jgi:hypothetical protein
MLTLFIGICALSTGHQRGPARAFATYWNGLVSSADREVRHFQMSSILLLMESAAIAGVQAQGNSTGARYYIPCSFSY